LGSIVADLHKSKILPTHTVSYSVGYYAACPFYSYYTVMLSLLAEFFILFKKTTGSYMANVGLDLNPALNGLT